MLLSCGTEMLLQYSSAKNENSVKIYLPSCCYKPLRFSFFWETQKRIFLRMFQHIFVHTVKVNGDKKYTELHQISL